MVLLAVETTSTTGSLILAEVTEKSISHLAIRRWQKKSSHSEVITLELTAALAEAGLELSKITHLTADVGPGSFTGIRVGLNLIRTLAYALDRPVRLFNSLEVHALQSLAVSESAVIHIPAIQTYVYTGIFSRTLSGIETLMPVQSLTESQLSEFAEHNQMTRILRPDQEPRAETLVELTRLTGINATFISWENVKPLYIRSSEAEEKLWKGLLKPVP